jgi:predicted nuclease of predicted toxin-antitoxin system
LTTISVIGWSNDWKTLFPESSHVRFLNLERAPDNSIWEFALKEGFVIVTQDTDFIDWNRLRGSPPKVILIRFGNQTTSETELRIRNAFDSIQRLNRDQEMEIIEIW